MDDLLSVALSEAGLDEFFVGSISGGDSSNDVSNGAPVNPGDGSATAPVHFQIEESSPSPQTPARVSSDGHRSVDDGYEGNVMAPSNTTTGFDIGARSQQHQQIQNVGRPPSVYSSAAYGQPAETVSVAVPTSAPQTVTSSSTPVSQRYVEYAHPMQSQNDSQPQHNDVYRPSFSTNGQQPVYQQRDSDFVGNQNQPEGLRLVQRRESLPPVLDPQTSTSYTPQPQYANGVRRGGTPTRTVVRRQVPPGTHYVRTVNEHGETVLRTVRTVSSLNPDGQPRTPQPGQQRIVVVRQHTPNGPVLVRHVATTNARGQTVLRRLAPRGSTSGSVRGGRVITGQNSIQRIQPQIHFDGTASAPTSPGIPVQHSRANETAMSPSGVTRTVQGARGGGMTSNVVRINPAQQQMYRTNTGGPQSQVMRANSTAGGFSQVRHVSRGGGVQYSPSNVMRRAPASARGGMSLANTPRSMPTSTSSPMIERAAGGGGPGNMGRPQLSSPLTVTSSSKPQTSSAPQDMPQMPPTRVEDRFRNAPHMGGVNGNRPTMERKGSAATVSQAIKSMMSGLSIPTGHSSSAPNSPALPSSAREKEKKSAKDEMKAAFQMAAERAQRDIDEEEENLGYAETYSEYRPSKLRSGLAHPDSVVETASLSSVQPPDVRYQVSIPEYLIDTGAISALQLEAVIYACQMHEQRLPSGERLGYLIGDGAGVGKGRTVACIIFENYLLGRKRAIWLSVSSDLKFDSERDLRDIGAGNIKVYQLNKFKYAKISGKENGSVKKGVIFATYSSLIGECRTAKNRYRSRLKQLIQWFGPDYDGAIILDECHRAKNLVPGAGGKPTKTGRMVVELQKALPNARVVYASATGATEPRNMAYMTRLGLWGTGQAFPEFTDFINAVERRGVGAMEIVAMDMKQRGLYLARQLSFRGVSFRVEEVRLSDEFVKIYDESVKLWMEVRRQFQRVADYLAESDRLSNKHLWGQFWACHQRFFKYLCIGAKVEAAVAMSRLAISEGKCVVIGLQSTGEARTKETVEELGGELTEFVSTARAVLQGLIDKHFPGEKDPSDPFNEFDKYFGDSKPSKSKKRVDALADMGFPSSSSLSRSLNEPAAKKSKPDPSASVDTDENSTTSSDDSDSDGKGEEFTDSAATDTEEEADDVDLGDRQEDWVSALMAEAASSSEDSGDENVDSDKEDDVIATVKKEEAPEPEADAEEDVMNQRHRLLSTVSTGTAGGDDEFNPFSCDFSTEDPWATKQQVVDGSPRKRTLSVVQQDEEEKERLKEKHRKRKEKHKRRVKRRKKREEERLAAMKKRQLDSEAMKSSATDFMQSSRLIDQDSTDDVNPSLIKAELLAAVERLGPRLPANTLDHLIDELGGPEFVAEMTGRKGRIVQREDGEIEYELRHSAADVPLELINMDEKDKFMKGGKLIAIISEAASSGISLQADRRAPNTRKRTHITLELPWSADKAIQQFGRTHRSNQVSAPEYVFLISELAGEKRFASIVAKRLESLGALTHGDRRATESRDLSQFNLDTKYGRAALDVLLRCVTGTLTPPLLPPPEDYKPGNFFEDMRLYLDGVGVLSKTKLGQWIVEKEGTNMSKFLNRILGLPVHAQNALFRYFSDILSELIAQSKHDGTYDMGIMDLGTGGDQVRKLETRVFVGRREKGSFKVEMHKIGVERGVSWEDAMAIYKEHNANEDGFYISNSMIGGKRVCALVYGIGKKRLDTGARLFAVTRPSTGRSPKLETFAELSKRFEKTDVDAAQKNWNDQYEGSSKMCQHKYIHNKCRNETAGIYCEVGRRTRTYFVLSGSVLSVWPVVEEVLSGGSRDKKSTRMQVIRVRTEQDQKIVGLLVLPQYVRTLVAQLSEHCGRFYLDTKGNWVDEAKKTEGEAATTTSSTTTSTTSTSATAPPLTPTSQPMVLPPDVDEIL